MLKADQQAKLLCFCTGPAIYNPPLNWLCEFMSSLIFVRLYQACRLTQSTSQRRQLWEC